MEEFGALTLIKAFSTEFLNFFTVPETIQSSDVLSIIRVPLDLDGPDVLRVWQYLVKFIGESSEKSKYHIACNFRWVNFHGFCGLKGNQENFAPQKTSAM